MLPVSCGSGDLAGQTGLDAIQELQGLEHGGRFREAVTRLESTLKTRARGQVELPLRHHFAEGQYGRELFIPKGTLLIGRIHKHTHLNIISAGDITVATELGVQRIKAPCTFVSKPGTKRVGYTHEDTIWTTVHVTVSGTDLKRIEREVIAESFEELDAFLGVHTLPTIEGGSE